MYATRSVLLSRRPTRQQARRRTVIIALALLAGLLGPLAAHVRASSEVRIDPVRVTVQSGDTLWDLAQRHAAPVGDIREVVFRIRQANGLRTSVLQPGQVLVIPQGR